MSRFFAIFSEIAHYMPNGRQMPISLSRFHASTTRNSQYAEPPNHAEEKTLWGHRSDGLEIVNTFIKDMYWKDENLQGLDFAFYYRPRSLAKQGDNALCSVRPSARQ